MRQKTGEQVSKNHRQQRTVSEHFTKEKKVPVGKQFSYNKLINEQQQRMHYDQQQQAMKSRSKPARPPAPQTQPQEGILIDLSPEEIRSMNMTLQSQASVSKPTSSSVCILDEPIEVPTEGFHIEEHHQIAPPPYPMPPQYLNTSSLDPFDTTHLSENLYSNSSMQMRPEPIYNNNPNRYTTSAMSDPLSELLSSSLASMSLANVVQSENINGQPVTPKKVEKQMLDEQLTGAKDASKVKLSLDQLMNASVSAATATTARSYDPFSPIQPDQTFVNNNYSATYGNQSATDARSIYDGNIYNSVAGDSVYGENFYDAVQSQAPSVIYDSTASIYSAQQQQAIYDEVSAYDMATNMRWQPQAAALRPAPAPPLSQQQINRRLDKINQQHSVVAELMNKLSMDNMTEEEAKEALDSSNWNQDLATRHFKIERLSK